MFLKPLYGKSRFTPLWDHFGYSIIRDCNSDYVVAGKMDTTGAEAIIILRFESDLDEKDGRWIEGSGGYGRAYSIDRTNNCEFVLTGRVDDDLFLSRFDSDSLFTPIWHKRLSSTLTSEGRAVIETFDNGIVVAGIYSDGSDDDILLAKTNSIGNQLWTKRYGVSGSDQIGYSANEDSDHMLWIAGYATAWGAGSYDDFAAKCDSDGITCVGDLGGYNFGSWNPDDNKHRMSQLAVADVNAEVRDWLSPTINSPSCTITTVCLECPDPPDPPVIDGPSYCTPGIYPFEACTEDPNGCDISYFLDWDDGTNSGWTSFVSSGICIIKLHDYSVGEYLIRAKAKNICGIESEWSYHQLMVCNPPNPPIISGDSSGVPGIYTFCAETTDPAEDSISYFFDWGDGTDSGWTEFVQSGDSICRSHEYFGGEYLIKVKAMNTCGIESEWSFHQLIVADCQGICGDANCDGCVNLADLLYIMYDCFGPGPSPCPVMACGDANGDGNYNSGDAVWLINYIFASGDPPGNCAPGSWGGYDCCPFEGYTPCNSNDPGLRDTVRVLSVHKQPSDTLPTVVGIPITLFNDEMLDGGILGLYYDSGDVSVDSVSLLGGCIESLPPFSYVDADSNLAVIIFYTGTSLTPVYPGDSLLATLWFTINAGAEFDSIGIDSGYYAPAGDFTFATKIGDTYLSLSPEFKLGFIIVGCAGMCGDANYDGGVNVADAVWIINYVFVSGSLPPQPVLACGDANGDCGVNVADAVWIINYVFVAGSLPPGDCCPCHWDDQGGDCCPFEPRK